MTRNILTKARCDDMTQLTLAIAKSITEAAFEHAQKSGMNPLTIAVLDAGGHLVCLQRSDNSSVLRPQIAISKAATALALGSSSRKVGDLAAERPAFFEALGQMSQHVLTPVAGGVIMEDSEGHAIGTIGVTGDTSDNDEECAIVGIRSAGLVPR